MKVRMITLFSDIIRGNGRDVTWVEQNRYLVVREFSGERLLIDINGIGVKPDHPQLTLIYKSDGEISWQELP